MKTIFFDFNGTLLDDKDISLKVFNEMLIQKNMQPQTMDQYLDNFGFPVKHYYQSVGFDFNRYSFEQLSIEFIAGYNREVIHCQLFDGVKEVLANLKTQGYRLVILSASEINLLKRLLITHRIDHYFDEIMGLDNIHAYSKVELAKAYAIANHLDLHQTYLIGDTLHDFEVAQAIGCRCLLIANGHQNKKRLSTSQAFVLDDIQEIVDYLV